MESLYRRSITIVLPHHQCCRIQTCACRARKKTEESVMCSPLSSLFYFVCYLHIYYISGINLQTKGGKMVKTKTKDEIVNFINLFVPSDNRKKLSRQWLNNVTCMFTNGYCYEFAKALRITFGHKYITRIIGTGNIGLYDIHTEEQWRTISEYILADIELARFLHFMFYARGKGFYDIYGKNKLETDKTRAIYLFSRKQKNEFLSDLKLLSLEAFKEKYLVNHFNDLKVVWMCTDKDLKQIELFNLTRQDSLS